MVVRSFADTQDDQKKHFFGRFFVPYSAFFAFSRPIFNQIRRYSPTKIEKSKKFLSPFLTSTYGNHKSRIDLYFRLKRAGSPYYRGTSFSLPEFTQSLSPGAAYLTRSRGMLAHLLFCRGAARYIQMIY